MQGIYRTSKATTEAMEAIRKCVYGGVWMTQYTGAMAWKLLVNKSSLGGCQNRRNKIQLSKWQQVCFARNRFKKRGVHEVTDMMEYVQCHQDHLQSIKKASIIFTYNLQ